MFVCYTEPSRVPLKMKKVRVWNLVGDRVVWPEDRDEVFGRFLRRLKTVRVCLVNNLKDPRDGEPLDGFGLRGWPLCINATLSKSERLKTLIHELSHLLFPDAEEETIREVERVLWKKFTKKQRATLETYIPKRALQKVPSRATRQR